MDEPVGEDDLGAARRALMDALSPGSLVVVVSGPGGVGKGTVVQRLLAEDDRLHVNRSWTTRDPRPGEDPEAYRFSTREEFEDHARSGGFLEWVEFLDYLQGSPVPKVPEGHDVIFEIDVAGGERIAKIHPDPLLVFVDAPDRATQAERMRLRGDPEEKIRRRLEHAESEVSAAADLPYVHLVNDDLEATVEELRALIEDARADRRS
ncbi:MAG: AAA family ATPase [Microthrixaceae bacterium]|nr:AAA family ATPase [Microthrixaceae bacterium]MCB9386511.1 AAA family ATPase [Microthrixaceae bacterium]MCO5320119.1 AAA family ATPase [Microthrixaceae bacterium]